MLFLQSSAFLLLLPFSSSAQSSTTSPLTNPTPIPCPSDIALVRSAGPPGNQSLPPSEHAYISTRAATVLPRAWKTYLQNANTTSPTPLPSYISAILTGAPNTTLPRLALAVSGGGYRATLFGAGVLSALDARNTTAAQHTGTGGLLQAASYLSGLSGGSWLVTALAQADFPTIFDLAFPPQAQANAAATSDSAYGGLIAQVDLLNPGGKNVSATQAYYEMLIAEVKAKHNATGLPITVTDPWSRSLARHFMNGTSGGDVEETGLHGAGVLFSDIAKLPSFTSHGQPFPIIIADTFSPNPNMSALFPKASVPFTNEIWEFNVFETGSFDPNLASFTPTSLLGSTNSSNCLAGFDQAAFIAGISSNLFNEFNTSSTALAASSVGPLIELIDATFPPQHVRLDSAAVPNPFKGVNPSTYSNTNETFVTMLDGGLDGEVIPFQPLLVRARGVDTIIAIDADADTDDNYANGTELIASAQRAALFGPTYPFPSVPANLSIFAQQNLTRHATFFGCNDSTDTPMVIYVPNGGPPHDGAAPVTNTSTFQTTYTPVEVQSFLDQAFTLATQGIAPPSSNGSTDPEFGACLACAVVDRARARAGMPREGVCVGCFERYCWVGDGASAVGSGGAGGNSTRSQNGAGRAVGVGLGVVWLSMFGLGVGFAM